MLKLLWSIHWKPHVPISMFIYQVFIHDSCHIFLPWPILYHWSDLCPRLINMVVDANTLSSMRHNNLIIFLPNIKNYFRFLWEPWNTTYPLFCYQIFRTISDSYDCHVLWTLFPKGVLYTIPAETNLFYLRKSIVFEWASGTILVFLSACRKTCE